ncbi:MAG: preprotein translocase subunit SecE [Actinomycetota bacterium]
MNRQTKRLMARQQKAQEKPQPAARRTPQPEQRKKRVPARQFLREVRQELKKVDWPTRKELFAYTIVVLVTVVVMTSLVFGLDYLFSNAVLKIFGS